MRNNLFLFFLFVSSILIAQTKNITVKWTGVKKLHNETYNLTLPYFSNTNAFNFDLDKGLLFVQEWASGEVINSNSLSVTNIQYKSISKSDIKDLKNFNIPSSPQVTLKNAIDRNKISNLVYFSPIVKVGNSYKKVVSISFSYSVGNSSASRIAFNQSVTNSVLQNGNWYKFVVDKTGVHILDKNFLEDLGINTSRINPKNIKIYGNGGKMLPYLNSDTTLLDPTENAIKVIGEQDGVFNDDDFVLFYAEGPTGYNADSNTFLNIYNNETYYYINVGAGNGKRIKPFIQTTLPNDETITNYKSTKHHEVDEINLAFVGRRWFGDKFDVENIKDFNFNFPNLDTSIPVTVKAIVASASGSPSNMLVSVNNDLQTSLSFAGTAGPNAPLVNEALYIGNLLSSSTNVKVTLEHDKLGNPNSEAYIDYIFVEGTSDLTFNAEQFQFKPNPENINTNVATLSISNTSAVQEIWEVSDIFNVTSIPNPNLSTVAFKSVISANQNFNIVTSNDYYRPRISGNTLVYNQNLKGTIFNDANGNFQDIDYLMLTPASHLAQANRLAQINRTVNGLNVKVVTLSSIYNEFNTGNPDISAIRNFVRYVYKNASATSNRLKYLCLFGDGSFDYKGRIFSNTYNFPSWHAYSSFNLTNSFVSDDFYGMMDLWEGSLNISDRLDVAVGRILADSPQRAQQLVNKIQQYYSRGSLGAWRNNVLVVSDDVDENWEGILQQTTDNIGNTLLQEKPFFNVKKIHTDAFQQKSTAGGDRYPDVNTAFANEVEKGAMVINFFGHGGEDGLAKERVLNVNNVINFRNVCKYHCFVTVTCEFTKFDNPLRLTAGEYAYWNPEGGAINLLTTTREIFVPVGTAVNNTLGEYLFSYSDNDTFADNEYPSIAEALRLTKNDPSVAVTQQKLLVFSIGDPALKLAIPRPNIKLTKVNDVDIALQTEPLSALGNAKIEGEVLSEQGALLSNYNGTLTAIIFDKNEKRTTLANDRICMPGTSTSGQTNCPDEDKIRLDYENLGPIIFRGQATVTNGKFSFEFVVPRDISIPVGNGRVSFYASEPNSLLDKTGASVNELKIGGINENAPEDNIGPKITLHMNDTNFVSGGITNREPLLLASFEDTNGINTASGIGHDITAIIDGDEVNPFVLNDYYLTEVDDYTKGNLDFKFRDLEPGLHTLTLKAWDVYNNSSTAEIQFLVIDENKTLVIDNVLNYPNPFINYTEFWFTHNSSSTLDISVQIFTVSGKLVRTLNGQTNINSVKNALSSTSREIIWDGKDDFGDKIGKGTYIYKIKVHSSTLNKTVEKVEKLVILQ